MTRALPGFDHQVLFLSPPDEETAEAFAPVEIAYRAMLTPDVVARFQPELVLLHNTVRSRISGLIAAPTIQYLHSAIAGQAEADATLCCSHWLARRIGMPAENVLWQGVPRPGGEESASLRGLRSAANRKRLVVGRICTPVMRKWPRGVVSFYGELARRYPEAEWEFVGCPAGLQVELLDACGGRAMFHAAGWRQRSLMRRWQVLLYSNRELAESFGRTVAEAMRAGCVPVVDRRGGFVEQVPDGGGILCSTRDDFASAVELLAEPTTWESMSVCASRYANDVFSLGRFARDLCLWFDRARSAARTSRLG